MKPSSICLFALALTLAAGPAFGQDALKPLRTLVYDVSYDAQQVQEEKTSGFDSGGDPTVQHQFDVGDKGKLTVNVVAATSDGGLVVDAAFAGQKRTDQPMRVGIFSDGRLTWDLKKELSPEVIRLLPFLARGLIADREIAPGDSWVIPAPAPASGTATYKITAVDQSIAHLSLQSIMNIPGPPPYDESADDTTAYDVHYLMPVNADLVINTRRRVNASSTQTTRIHLTAKLTSDTFAHK